MPLMEPVLILGAGPSGLATAACLRQRGIRFALWDRQGATGGAFRRMYRGMRLLSPRPFVHLPRLPYPGGDDYPTIPAYQRYLDDFARHFELQAQLAESPEATHPCVVAPPDARCRVPGAD